MSTLLERICDTIAPETVGSEDAPGLQIGTAQPMPFLDPLREADIEGRVRSRQAQWRLRC